MVVLSYIEIILIITLLFCILATVFFILGLKHGYSFILFKLSVKGIEFRLIKPEKKDSLSDEISGSLIEGKIDNKETRKTIKWLIELIKKKDR